MSNQNSRSEKTGFCEELLLKRGVPCIRYKEGANFATVREQLAECMQREVYGYRPLKPEKITYRIVEEDTRFCAGKALLRKVEIDSVIDGRSFVFPTYAVLPRDGKKHPFFVHINFRDNVPDKYMPSEELVDNGFAVLSFCYQDVTTDNADFEDGLAGILYKDGQRSGSDCGKIAMWSWAASRVMDYAQTIGDCLDLEKACVCGHSRLGKTALLTGMLDERFRFVFSNDSGCSGAALSHGKKGETIEKICQSFPYWFCPHYQQYASAEELPFDQHFVLAACAPRYVYVASAKEDTWADPESEYLSCCEAGKTYEALGLKGFVHPDRLPIPGDAFMEGSIGYHLRPGDHYFSREDWLHFMEFIKRKLSQHF